MVGCYRYDSKYLQDNRLIKSKSCGFMVVKIKKSELEKIFLDAEKCHPYEACGILAGKIKDEIIKAYPVKNILLSPVEYELDPEQLYQTLRQIENDNLKLLGFYHSHPHGNTVYSKLDEDKSNFWESHLYFIVSPKRREYTCYRRNERLQKQDVITI